MFENEDIQSIMEEPPGGENHGRLTDDDHSVELGGVEAQTAEFMRSKGFTVVHEKNQQGSGMTAHRGVLHPDEYVSGIELQRLVEAELGFTYAQIRAVYRQGPLSKEQRQLREQIDARLLALRRSGANLTELARSIGFAVKPNGSVTAFDNAVSRAKAVEQWKANLS